MTFAQRGYRLIPGEHCGEHDVALYLARVRATEREFQGLARKAARHYPVRLSMLLGNGSLRHRLK
jgi:hypothetical protein